jgi:porin
MVTVVLPLVLIVLAQAEEPAAPPSWLEGEHLTTEWNGDRNRLADHGLTIDLYYSVESFLSSARIGSGQRDVSLLGHIDAALTLDTEKLGLWPGGKFYFLGQANHGTGVNELVGSATAISNYEQAPFTQLTEFFYEQALFDEHLKIRLGKQDANREFGTPRYGGNFINNNFGMFPTTPLPSYPTTGLGAAVIVEPADWISARAVVFEGNPLVESLGFDSAAVANAGYTVAVGAAVTHHYGVDQRNGGTTSAGAWGQHGVLPELTEGPSPKTFDFNAGFMVQNDERIYQDPSDKDNPSGLNVIARFAWSLPDRTPIALYAGASVAWHGLGSFRDNDTIGIGFGYFSVAQQLGGTPGRGDEFFIETFYKARLTHFFSIQPDLQFYAHPGGDGPSTLLAGVRFKVKL